MASSQEYSINAPYVQILASTTSDSFCHLDEDLLGLQDGTARQKHPLVNRQPNSVIAYDILDR